MSENFSKPGASYEGKVTPSVGDNEERDMRVLRFYGHSDEEAKEHYKQIDALMKDAEEDAPPVDTGSGGSEIHETRPSTPELEPTAYGYADRLKKNGLTEEEIIEKIAEVDRRTHFRPKTVESEILNSKKEDK